MLHDESPPRNQPDASGVARITQHVEVVRDATAGLLVQARGCVVTTVAALAGLVTVAGPLGWLVAAPVVLSLAVFACLLPSLARRQRAVALADERTAERAGTVLAGMRDVVACGARAGRHAAVFDAIDGQAAAAVPLARASALRSLVISTGGFVPLLLVLAAGAGHGGARRADARARRSARSSTSPPRCSRRCAASPPRPRPSSCACWSHCDRLAEIADLAAPNGRATQIRRATDVVVRGLTFGWGARREPIVRDLDLALAPGEHLAVVGPSGIGKSTVAGLLTGMLDPGRGRGQPRRHAGAGGRPRRCGTG